MNYKGEHNEVAKSISEAKINSKERKKALSGCYFYKNGEPQSFKDYVVLQKFLFFFECFSKIDGDEYELSGLKGYTHGPVFSAVYGDLRHDRSEFIAACSEAFQKCKDLADNSRVKLSEFLVKILGERLSEFTHGLNIWSSKQKEIESGTKDLPLNESDLSERDISVFRGIERAYPESYIDAVNVFNINDTAFVIYKNEEKLLTASMRKTLCELSLYDDLISPVYISFDEEGGLLID